jgi:DNA-binding transcriptional MerR regulator
MATSPREASNVASNRSRVAQRRSGYKNVYSVCIMLWMASPLATAATLSPVGSKDAPLFAIQEVSRRTGVPKVTLRAWERRYGVPSPERMGNRYRLYSERQVEQIVALVRLVDSGIAIRQAAFLVARRKAASADGDSTARLSRAWRSRLGSACLRFDEPAADAVLTEAEGLLPRADILHLVLLPVVAELGDAQHTGVISISQEHFASGVARRFVARTDVASPPTARRPIVTGCAPGERHELGLLAVVCRLREAGRPVVHLGPDVPPDSLLATVDRVKSPAVVVGVTLGDHLRPWGDHSVEVRRRARRGCQFIWAGPAGEAAGRLGLAGAVCASIDETVEAAKIASI